jgi:hypothetical protein
MKRSWADFHVEPIEAEDEEDYVPGAKHPHRRAIWRGIDLTTMHNDEVHGVKDAQKPSDCRTTAEVERENV